jgi:hypothetical protein
VEEVGCASPWWAARWSAFPPASGERCDDEQEHAPGAVGLGIWGNLGVWIAFGSLFGLLVGIFFDNIALGIPLGLALGAGLGVAVGSVVIARRNARDES